MKTTRPNNDWRRELDQAAQQLRDPFRMRVAIALVMVVILLFAISDPLHGKTKKSQRELQQLREKVKTAQEVLLLTDSLENLDSRIIQSNGNDAVTGLFINLFRDGTADLQKINAEASQRLGPIYSVRVTLDLVGEFADLNDALYRLETQPELIRVESVQITPADRGASRPMMQLSVRLLKENE